MSNWIKFIKFLMNNGALNNYWKEVSLGTLLGLLTTEPENYLMYSFIWWDSVKGDIYWQKLHQSWNEELNNEY